MTQESAQLWQQRDSADEALIEEMGEPIEASVEGEEFFIASQWQLMWWRFRRHKLALISMIVTIAIYVMAIFAGFFAPFDPRAYSAKYAFAPPQPIRFYDRTENGGIKFGLYIYDYKVEQDPETFKRTFVYDLDRKIPVRFLAKGTPYKLAGLIPARVRFLAPVEENAPMFLLGADRLGRDMLSRIIFGAQISLSIGLVGVFLSFFLGIIIGGFAGYLGGLLDEVVQRLTEFLRSIPSIPLWMGLSAAVPPGWDPLTVYFAITVILSLRGWTGMARVVRGRFLSLREEDFILAARLDGASNWRIVVRYMVPSFLSYIIARITMAVPGMILGETSLSFLGLGLRPPLISWGVLLKEAQAVRVLVSSPWLLYPGLAVVLTVLAMNFMGDGLRDAADPYA
jgi:peptide/nickel transport system permease protein